MKHEQQLVAITMDDGSVAIMGFVTVGRGAGLPYGAHWIDEKQGIWGREASDANIFAEICKLPPPKISNLVPVAPQAVSYRRIKPEDVPQDRTFRGAWKDSGKAIDHDIEIAREIKRKHIRRDRVKAFAENDVAVLKALSGGDKVALEAANARAQQLRDAPADPRIEAAQTVDELKAIG